jgi:hypothetical protein
MLLRVLINQGKKNMSYENNPNNLEDGLAISNQYLLEKIKKANMISVLSIILALLAVSFSFLIPGTEGPIGNQGLQGLQGLSGEKGETGKTGLAGQNGISPFISCSPVRVLTDVDLSSSFFSSEYRISSKSKIIYSCE